MSATSPTEGIPSFIDPFGIEARDLPGRYRARIGSGWSAPIFPSGGVVSALALGVMARELGVPAHRLRTSTTMFASKVAEGEVEIDVDVLRRGKRMSQVRASIRNAGDAGPGHHLIAAFGEDRDGLTVNTEAAPTVGGPEDYEPPPVSPQSSPAFLRGFFNQIDSRRVKLFQSFEEDWEGGQAEALRWMRYRDRQGPSDVYGLVPLADTMPPSIGQYLGPGHRLFHAPSVDLTFHALAEPEGEWILTRSRTRWGADGYASAEIHLWDEARRLVAYATQLMLIRFPDPSEFK